MERCAICDVTSDDNPKAGIKWYVIETVCCELRQEPRCLECHGNIEANIEDLSLSDEEFEFQVK